MATTGGRKPGRRKKEEDGEGGRDVTPVPNLSASERALAPRKSVGRPLGFCEDPIASISTFSNRAALPNRAAVAFFVRSIRLRLFRTQPSLVLFRFVGTLPTRDARLHSRPDRADLRECILQRTTLSRAEGERSSKLARQQSPGQLTSRRTNLKSRSTMAAALRAGLRIWHCLESIICGGSSKPIARKS